MKETSGETVVQHEVLLAVRKRLRDVFRLVESSAQVRDLGAHSPQALEHGLVADEIRRKQPHDRLVVRPRIRCRLLHPFAERALPLLRQRVVRALPSDPLLFARPEVAQPLEPLRLRVVLAVGRARVDAASTPHPNEVVSSRAAVTNEDENDVAAVGTTAGERVIPDPALPFDPERAAEVDYRVEILGPPGTLPTSRNAD